MTYTLLDNTASTVFHDEIKAMCHSFEKWYDCERAVAMCQLLKVCNYPILRFIQSKIEAIITQNSRNVDFDGIQWLEQLSNSKVYLNDLCDSYKKLSTMTTTPATMMTSTISSSSSDVQLNNQNSNKDSIYIESDRLLLNGDNTGDLNHNYKNINRNATNINNSNFYISDKPNKKEDILNDLLNSVLLLKNGNNDAAQVYLSLIPFMVDDARHGVVNVEIAKQILSVLVAHPAISSEDRRTLIDHAHHLQNSCLTQSEQCLSNSWQAIVPPFSLKQQYESSESLWDLPRDYIEFDNGFPAGHEMGQSSCNSNEFTAFAARRSSDFSMKRNVEREMNVCCESNPSSKRSSDASSISKAGSYETTNGESSHYHTASLLKTTTTDDHHVSFSKNGTEIMDFDPDVEPSNAQFSNFNSFIVPATMLDHQSSEQQRTQRSNSLTTHRIHQLFSAKFTSSAENLAHMFTQQKQRSYSLSNENPRSMKMASGSDPRLDDLKLSQQTFQSQHVGMRYFGVWLKQLRLHKYEKIFEPFTFEQMMEISEEYLNDLGVTQGARNKLLNCIQKLKERYVTLVNVERDLTNEHTTIVDALKVLKEIVCTPMKPIEQYNNKDVGAQFLKVISMVCCMMVTKQSIVQQDEEAIEELLKILDTAERLNNEAFSAQIHVSQLKQLRFEIASLTMKLPQKNHYRNGITSSSAKQTRWSSSTKQHSKGSNVNKPHRKNSNSTSSTTSNFNFVPIQHQNANNGNNGSNGVKSNKQIYLPNNYYHQPSSTSYAKSSSNPSFSSSSSNSNTGNSCIQLHGNGGSQYRSYHRNSISNLITITPSPTTATLVTPTASVTQHQLQKTSSCVGLQSTTLNNNNINNSPSTIQSLNKNNTIGLNGNGTNTCTSSTSSASKIPQLSHGTNINSSNTMNVGRSSSTGGNVTSTSITTITNCHSKQMPTTSVLGDCSPYTHLESLSLQMTEQAIN